MGCRDVSIWAAAFLVLSVASHAQVQGLSCWGTGALFGECEGAWRLQQPRHGSGDGGDGQPWGTGAARRLLGSDSPIGVWVILMPVGFGVILLICFVAIIIRFFTRPQPELAHLSPGDMATMPPGYPGALQYQLAQGPNGNVIYPAPGACVYPYPHSNPHSVVGVPAAAPGINMATAVAAGTPAAVPKKLENEQRQLV